ncbi:hypothetical protein [Limnohabitans sp.]|jgi:hypothetical protein|uniref:hypothetical protein n=1 Tax=Limnohabitans sp. TaxID=1907725 RepID=UPI0037BFFF3C
MYVAALCTLLVSQFIIVGTARANAGELTEAAYRAEGSAKGVVLLDVDLGRYGRCGGNETAQLRRIAFNRMPVTDIKADLPADAEIIGALLPTAAPRGLRNYAFLLSPGEYAMTRISIRVSQSASQMGHLELGPEQLAPNGLAKAGSFRVSAGEIAYIGNFKVDCAPPMTLWRYYTEGKANFAEHLSQYRQSFPFLKLDDVQYRLFETKTIGTPYELK